MKVLVIGGGGREHAIVWALRQSARVREQGWEIVCAPGNGGMARDAKCVPVNVKDLGDLVRLVAEEQPDLTVIGPELPLSLGLVDEMQRRGLRVFGPTQAAAQLESSKAFAKEFMQRYRIPTAHYAVCTTMDEVREALPLFHAPLVVKADGLAAGKGVLICKTKKEAETAADGILSGALLGTADSKLVLEEFLQGDEISYLLICDGKHALPLAAAQDHKRIGEGDTGLNTGGMGAYSIDSLLDAPMREWLMTHVVQPTLDGMAEDGTPFSGVLYVGLMMTPRGPMVLEYNARFGDPETQAILPRLESDILEAFEAAVDGRLDEIELSWKPGASACVVAASAGYPGEFRSGFPIHGLESAGEDVAVFHSGTAVKDDAIVTAGGRVLAVTATAEELSDALAKVYAALGKIEFEGMYYRRDIGHRALLRGGRK
jgi:phosphoribosylamine--glycine ligase